MTLVLLGLAVLVLVGVAITIVAAALFSKRLAAIEATLAATPVAAVCIDLPARVEEFARRGMADGRPVGAVRLTQSAEMRLERGGAWKGLAARQVIAASEPGFAWIAAQKAGPLPIVRVLDAYVKGEGVLEIRLLGAFRLGIEGGPEAALGEGLRYLAELPWSPDAILTNPHVIWTEVDGGVAVELETAGGTARVVFSFDPAGDITGMYCPGRLAKQPDGSLVSREWVGTLSDYKLVGGRRIPVRGEVGYIYDDGYEGYWRGEITRYTPVE